MMRRLRRTSAVVATVATVAALGGLAAVSGPAVAANPPTTRTTPRWPGADRAGSTRLTGQVPLAVSGMSARLSSQVRLLGTHADASRMSLNFSLPLHDKAGLDRLIATEAKTHHYLSHAEVAARFAPPQAQVDALQSWLTSAGFTVTHVDASRTAVAAEAPTATVEQVLSTKVSDFRRAGYTYHGVEVPAYRFFANTVAPRLPARLGVIAVSGLTDIDRFYTQAQLSQGARATGRVGETRSGGPDATHDRTGTGYYPSDLRSMYDVTGHGVDATGQTVGFTLWGPNETQQAMTLFAAQTGDTAITIDTACKPTGNSPTKPSSCVNTKVAPNHELAILENGNDNGTANPLAFGLTGSTIETALDMEAAHGMAPGVAEKYYLADCSMTAPPGTGDDPQTDFCNGSDVGLEEAIEDAASDPTLHTVSNSWGWGGEAEAGGMDPFRVASENSFALGAAAGTTFWFSTGDDGTYFSGFPADSPYVVGVGGTSLFSHEILDPTTTGAATRSTATAWAAGGSWCSVVEARPSWQNGPGVTARAGCPGRAVPDISAVADSATGFNTVFSASAIVPPIGPAIGTPAALAVGGTSLAAPVMNGLAALTQAFLAKQTYGSATKPAVGFEGPMIYTLGNSADSSRYFFDVDCGNTANPAAGPDGDAAGDGWDPATGFGELDWFHYATGYAIALGATGLSQPSSVATSYDYSCAQTPTNADERGVSMPTAAVGYAVGSPSDAPWPSIYLDSGSYTATNTFLKTDDGGVTWQPTNSDVLALVCVSGTTCVEVGDGGRIRRTTDSGATWTYVTSPFTKALTSLVCPTATVCYAAGDRGVVLRSTDAGATWSYTSSADGNPLYGLACPSESVCYAVDDYAYVQKTTDGGATWSLIKTPVTSPDANIPGSAGPHPDAGLFGITCTSTTTCTAIGGFPPDGDAGVILTSTNGGATWTQRTSNTGDGNYLNGVTCLPSTCYAVGRGGTIVTSTDAGATWTKMTSNTTVQLTGISCSAAGACVATGQGGLIDVLSGTTWTVTDAQAGGNFLAAVTCLSPGACIAAGQHGVTVAFNPGSVASSAKLLAGGGTPNTMDAVSCVDAGHCATAGDGGTILTTSDAGQTWLTRDSKTTDDLAGVSCFGNRCEAVGGAAGLMGTGDTATIVGSSDGGATWTDQSANTDAMTVLTAIDCTTSSDCVAVGGSGTIIRTTDGGATWTDETSGTTSDLAGVSCVRATPVAPAGAATLTSCSAVGSSGAAVRSNDGGTTWTAQTTTTSQDLSNVTCDNRFACFASGALGTVVTTTNGGTTWTQRANPISGPTAALNPGPSDLTATYASACSPLRCAIGTASAGDIMTTPTVTVSVTAAGPSATAPALSGLAPTNPVISYSPTSEAGHVTGTLTCTTTATGSSPDGRYPLTGCSGLGDPDHSVVYDLDASSYTVGKQAQVITFPTITPQTYGAAPITPGATSSSGLPVTYAATGACRISSGKVVLTGAGTCTVKAGQLGNVTYAAAAPVSRSFTVAKATPGASVKLLAVNPSAGRHSVVATLTTTGVTKPTGSVVLSAGSRRCTATVKAGTAHCSLLLPAGQRLLRVSYAGDKNFKPVAATRSVGIAKIRTGVGIVRTRVRQGSQDFRVRAHVFGGTGGLPATGRVSLRIAGDSCSAKVVKSFATCVLTIPAGTAPLHIHYSGDTNFKPLTKDKTLRTS